MTTPEQLERKRRSQKSAFKRLEDTLKINLVSNRTVKEVSEGLEKLEKKYQDCELAHNVYCSTLDDTAYEEQEDWMDDIENRFNEIKCKTLDYVEKMQSLNAPKQNPVKSTAEPTLSASKTKITTDKLPFPRFSGKISEYLIFKRDWKEVVESRYGLSAEVLYLLKRNVGESVQKWIESISDYESAWKILDEQYGNSRWISDQMINDLKKIGAVNTINQFVELYHASNHAYNVLQELDHIQDLDNSTFLGILERKLTMEDRTSWAKAQRHEHIEPSVKTFIRWMNDQIWIKKVAGAEIRSGPSGSKSFLVEVESESEMGPTFSEKCTLYDAELVTDEAQAELLCGFTAQDPPYKPSPCWFCDSAEHTPSNCQKFKSLNPNARLEKTREKKVCYFCLRRHRLPCMKQRIKCTEKTVEGEPCPYFHHPLLHGARFDRKVSENKGDCSHVSTSASRLLPIVTTLAKATQDPANRRVNCLIDSGSQLTLIRDKVAQSLKLCGDDTELEITGVGGVTRKHRTKVYNLTLLSLGENKSPVRIQAIGIPQIGQNRIQLDKTAVANMFGIQESDIYRDDGEVDILIGVDHVNCHTGSSRQVGQYILRNSVLGLVVFGCQITEKGMCGEDVYVNYCSDPKDITRFWSTEELGVTLNWCCQQRNQGDRLMTATEKRDETEIRQSAKKGGDRWQIPLPWARDPNDLPNNYIQALLKLQSLEKRLAKNPEHAKVYAEQVEQLVAAGSARILSREELQSYEGPIHYMSHHAVIRPDKPSHPCRMVFNQAESFRGHVINKYLKKGGDHLNRLVGVLIRWRERAFVLVGDVRKMYHQIQTCPGTDQNTHRFLWRNYEDREPDIYIKTVLTFGDISSPALANIAMDMTADEYQGKYPESSAAIKQNRYMDDYADSYSTVQELETRKREVDEILASGHFQIKAWETNVDAKSGGGSESEEETGKVLGVPWNKTTDQVSIYMNIPSFIPSLTKRIITGIIAGIYDVFGFGAPVIVKGKIKLQDLWRLKLDWDGSLPGELVKEWTQWLDEVRKLREMKFERCLTPVTAVNNPDLIIFCDASKKAFGAVAYCRYQLQDGTATTRFIMAKSRVAPLKTLSLPRLELQSVLIGSRLCETIQIESRCKFDNVYILTDSLITYSWILNESRLYASAVATRTGEILSKTKREYFAHCPSNENVADDVSRGLKVDELTKRWITGPEFLKRDPTEWPISRPKPCDDLEEKKMVGLCMPTNEEENFTSLDRIQPWKKMIRVTARIHRGAHNYRARKYPDRFSEKTGELSAEELIQAKQTLIKVSQKSLGELQPYRSLSPFVDTQGIVRVGGRVDQAEVSYDQMHPVLLPQNLHISKLIVSDTHQYGHPAPASTAAKVRKHYWIVGVQRIARSVVFNCIFCRQVRAKTEEQYMASLPSTRLIPAPPFTHCAIDLFGPYKVRIKPRVMMSVWGVIITCLGTRAVYCDIVLDYSTMELIQTLRRFLSLRGTPQTMMSDRGSQLVKADKEIRIWCAAREIEWTFVTPNAAHQNGCAEALVKSVKNAYKCAVGDTVLSAFEMQTALFEIANLVNERPIGVTNTHPDDGSYISPNGILLGRASDSIPQGPFAETRNPRHRVEFVQKILDAWWRRWYRDVFPLLTVRKKWHVRNRDVKVGDLVLLLEPNPFRGRWTRARITRVFPGADGYVRNVELKTKNGLYERSITKIAVLLPIEEQQSGE